MIYNFSPRANDLLAKAQLYVKKYDQQSVSSLHILLALIGTEDNTLCNILIVEQNVDIDRLTVNLEKAIAELPAKTGSKEAVKINVDPTAGDILKLSKQLSEQMDHSFIGTEHITLALICHTDCEASGFLYENNVDLPGLAEELKSFLNPQQTKENVEEPTVADAPAMKTGEALDMFSINMTELAKQNLLDPVVGREDEIERVMQILSRRQKNNPIIVGEPGVGKTALVEGLCNMIAAGDVPLPLRDKQIYNLDLSLMVAGTKFRGQFEERMKQVMNDLASKPNAIIFIDEIHMLVGAGNADGAMDAANILKPALSRGGLSCIGTTTFDEYREFIESDGALERRFQKIVVDEPDIESTIDILKGLSHKYESFHNVKYSDDAIDCAVKSSVRYITDRFLPDKAIDILDECAARVKLKQSTPDTSKIDSLQQKIADCQEQVIHYLKENDYVSAATYRSAEKKFLKQEHDLVNDQLNKRPVINITKKEVIDTVSKWCGVPLSHLKHNEKRKIMNLEKELNKRIVGQSHAVSVISDSVIRGRADVGDPWRPVGSFLLLGPTGVGKTYLAKQLAKYVFGDELDMIRVDMSELMESHSVSKLIGSPPGYVGYGEGGQLTEQVRQQPYSVILFDEIEKAHPDVMQLLLQLLDEGSLTDSRGVEINFKNCIILMTSNIGAERMLRNQVVGFGSTQEDNLDVVKKELTKFLRPELVNRLDEIVFFNSLDQKQCKVILNYEISKFIKRMKSQGVNIRVGPKVKSILIEKGFDKQYGARPLRRAIQSYLQTPLAKLVLSNQNRPLSVKLRVNKVNKIEAVSV